MRYFEMKVKVGGGVLVLLATLLVGCFAEPGKPLKASAGGSDTGGSDAVATAGSTTMTGGMGGAEDLPECLTAKGEALPARAEVMSADAQGAAKPVFTYDLFASFSSYCGGCHVQAYVAGFDGKKVTLQNFPKLVGAKALERIRSNDPTKVMPPLGSDAGKLWDERADDDGIRHLAGSLEEWMKNGSPASVYYQEAPADSSVSQYLLAPEIGQALTNLGNCIPNKASLNTEKEKSEELDAFFENATELPVTLEETDFVSFDSAELARHGVIAFAPAYPLWADDAKKMRFVRVPRGKSIAFNAKTQSFDIPPNTRFYKTFAKQVIDQEGNVTYRKMETRLIVARPDKCTTDSSGEHCTTEALMGTYAWNAEETRAELVRDPLRNGKPFADRLLTYVTDEKAAAKVKDPIAAGLTRHYAIPGSERCVQCHMGSVSKSGILGFIPLQIRRRPKGEGGNIEDTSDDELNQLERLIDYGVITGIEDEADVAKLENSQKEPPRNDYELTAQGYMLGNCAHCHNEHGYPSVKNPELRDVLKFFPSMTSGIFQFPLDKVSPRLHRGKDAQTEIPYITPSLVDMPPADSALDGFGTIYTEKSTFEKGPDGKTKGVLILAPWRSLIYRNVDTPFSYADDFAIFPHMPFNTPGYDCRVTRIMGDWMVSIPAQLKSIGAETQITDVLTKLPAIIPQPFVEVKPDSPFYTAKLKDTQKRLDEYHNGQRYDFCPDTSDIVDPKVVAGKAIVPPDDGYPIPDYPSIVSKDGVPDRPHWAVTDKTDVPGDWLPRRNDYADVLLNGDPDRVAELDEDRRTVVHVIGLADDPTLKGLKYSKSFKDFAVHELPMTLWSEKSACKDALVGEHHPDYFSDPAQNPDSERDALSWLQEIDPPKPEALVYRQSPGGMVFEQICRNCHGPVADGQSTLADTISTMTGGVTRVANLRDGLLGLNPAGKLNRGIVFGENAAKLGVATDDLAVRYVAWMALGGTEKPIPIAALVAVANTKVYGEPRVYDGLVFPQPPPASGNMLATARWLCRTWLTSNVDFSITTGDLTFDDLKKMPFVRKNGDAQVWRELCYWDNPAPVRALFGEGQEGAFSTDANPPPPLNSKTLYPRSAYPSWAPVGTLGGNVTIGLAEDNPAPWCIVKPSIPANLARAEAYWSARAKVPSADIPWCPDELLASPVFETDDTVAPDARNWALRGAANAGAAVFAYLDAIANGLKPRVGFDQCDRLLGSGM